MSVEITQAAPFKREERYIVIKRKTLDERTECALRTGLAGYGVDTVECVVVESDWPEYEVVWRMIEERVTGHRSTSTEEFRGALERIVAIFDSPIITEREGVPAIEQIARTALGATSHVE